MVLRSVLEIMMLLTREEAKVLLPQWENEHGRTIEILEEGSNEWGCEDVNNHPGVWVKLFGPGDCEVCYGEDPTGCAFCPVCEYCCGC